MAEAHVRLAMEDLPVGLCADCNEDGQILDRILQQHFQLQVCVMCKQNRNLRDGSYELISKSRAKVDFAMPESFFHGLPHMTKPNPHHEAFAPLKLYLKKMIMDEAYRLYDDKDGLEREKAARKLKAYTSAAKRTKHLLKRKHVLMSLTGEDKQQDTEQESEPKQKPKKPAYIPVADRDHKHQFAAEVYDETANSWFKECECGMKVEVEKW
uniref:XPA C-terminal domain-containing protein n=1 Tax=Globisporangium ultimum (strain ATCC 200006 / CBS 805.95 / DAOM BR144) TaxID=431595 RepID=K3WL41_GLOUD